MEPQSQIVACVWLRGGHNWGLRYAPSGVKGKTSSKAHLLLVNRVYKYDGENKTVTAWQGVHLTLRKQ